MVGDVNAHIGRPVLRGRTEFHLVAGNFTAERCQLAQGNSKGGTAANVKHASPVLAGMKHLVDDQIAQIVDVEHVTHLLALPAETDVGELPAKIMGGNPERDDALIGFTHLPGTGDEAAAIDGAAEAVGVGVFDDHELGSEFGHAVKRARAVEGEIFVDAAAGTPGNQLLVGQRKAVRLLTKRQGI